MKHILGIETSCDETAASIVSHDDINHKVCVRSHVVESQNESHAPFGGVVPEIAARDHLLKIDFVTRQALKKADLNIQDITSIAVTLGPGLIGALMVGVLYARGIVTTLNVPLIGVNHVDAHLAPCFFLPNHFRVQNDTMTWYPINEFEFPILALTVSGGHCHLSILKSYTERKILGYTLDDACGEAFDKVAKLLGLGYPGGAALEKLALQADTTNEHRIQFVQPFLHKKSPDLNRYNFSYSGLKTAALTYVKKFDLNSKTSAFENDDKVLEHQKLSASIAHAFQETALMHLKTRVLNAIEDFPDIKTIFIAGGVAQNKRFQSLFSDLPITQIFAPPELCSDNATMIALQSILNPHIDALQSNPFSRYQYDSLS